MGDFDQFLIISLFVIIIGLVASCGLWVVWLLVGGQVDRQADQADAMWQAIEDECRRMREAGIAD
jgi:hypothetical protein